MVGSMDSLEFCAEMPITEKNAIPLDCWHDINLSNIWIPSHLLPNRTKPSNMILQGIYHTLEKKDASRYTKSFSVYSSTENEQGEIFISDSEDDMFGSDSAISEKIQVSVNALPAIANHMHHQSSTYLNDLRNNTEANILNKNPERGNICINSKENLTINARISPYLDEIYQEGKFKKVISSNENMINMRKLQQNDGEACASLSNGINTGSQKNFAVKENFEVEDNGLGNLHEDTDAISLNDILDDTLEINMKDIVFDLKKRDDPFLLCSYDKTEKKVKKIKKNKVKKKPTKYVALDNFLDTKIEDSQDYYCDKYLQSLLNSKQKESSYSNVPVENNEEFPDLACDSHVSAQFIYSNKRKTNVKSDFNDLIKSEEMNENEDIIDESDKTVTENIKSVINNLTVSEEINKNEIIDGEEIEPYMTDAKYRKIVIENIPSDATEDDVLGILYGNGEIKNFSLVSAGKYFTAYIEIDLNCDIDWIIECLNGSEPFGASTEKILCYKQ